MTIKEIKNDIINLKHDDCIILAGKTTILLQDKCSFPCNTKCFLLRQNVLTEVHLHTDWKSALETTCSLDFNTISFIFFPVHFFGVI